MNELALFAGAGGGILGGKLLGWRTVCAVERDAYAAQVLAQRQNDGMLEPFPVWSDVCSFDGRPWRGLVDIVSGGFPCQDISAAGRGAGIDGERSGLWSEFARIIGEVRPRFALVENSPMLTIRGLGTVLGDLAALGFDAEWCVLGACDAKAPHERERIWILAHAEGDGLGSQLSHGPREICCQDWPTSKSEVCRGDGDVANPESVGRVQGRPEPKRLERRPDAFERGPSVPDPSGQGLEEWQGQATEQRSHPTTAGGMWWATEPAMGRVAHGVAHRVDRLKAIGNGQVPAVAALAFRTLFSRLIEN